MTLMGFAKGSTHPAHFNSLSRPESFAVIVISDDKGNDFVNVRHSGARSCASYDVQLHIRESITTAGIMDSGPAPSGASRNDKLF
jgi:hypothetical protein